MNSPLSYIDPSGLSFCDPAQQSWCGGGAGVPGSGRGGGYGTRTVSGWGTYVTFGIYHQIVRIWRSSSSFNSWDDGGYDGVWTDDVFWEDVQRSVIYPIVHWFRWAFQVVEQSAAAEPASSHSPDSENGEPMTNAERQAVNRRTFPSPKKILENYPDKNVKYCPHKWVENECAVRLGIALQNAKVDISRSDDYRDIHTHDPSPQIHQPGARALADYLEVTLGSPRILDHPVGWTPVDFIDREAIIYFAHPNRGGNLGFGHIDVISGGKIGSKFYENKKIWIWEYKDGKYVRGR